MLKNLVGCALAKTLLVLVLTVVWCVVEGVVWPLLAPMLLLGLYRRQLVFEVLLMIHIIESSLGVWRYFSRIDQYVYLGGIPMYALDHLSVLTLDLKVEAVLSINESYELQAVTLAGSPVSAGEWKKEDVQHLQLSAVDFSPPSYQVLDEGADWIQSHVKEKRVVYVHCKSGIGRSASVVAAYFMKHRHMNAQDAAAHVRSMRAEIFRAGSSQMANLVEYEKTIRDEQKFSVQP